MDSSAEVLDRKGYLTLNGFVKYLAQNRPILAVSYQTMLRFYKDGKIKATRVGGQLRISKEEIERYVSSTLEGGHVPSSPPSCEEPQPPTS